MKDQFDELAKGLAQSVTRRQALRRFGVGLAGAVLASLERHPTPSVASIASAISPILAVVTTTPAARAVFGTVARNS